ncbi:MAG TPA: T9SS type A sorting domain-containing protein, partial [Bacteroidetes bacterium]|nr:T9SS type A sorting domain-containing protein [Bacteroidota bacterium]
ASHIFSGGGTTTINYTVTDLPPIVLASYTDTLDVYETPKKANIDTNGNVVYIDTSYYAMQWYHEGNPVAGAIASYHTATQTGYYWLVGTNEFGCSVNTDTVFVINCNYGFPPNINVNNDVLWTDSVNYDLQWYLDGQLLVGDTNNILFADASGNYVLIATDSNKCTSNSNPVYVEIEIDTVIDTTSIYETELGPHNIQLYPNPNNGTFKLQFSIPNSSGGAIISLYNINGSIVRQNRLNNVKPGYIHNVNAKDLESGIYFVYIILDNGQINKKFIKY